jgi:hypothetical protein
MLCPQALVRRTDVVSSEGKVAARSMDLIAIAESSVVVLSGWGVMTRSLKIVKGQYVTLFPAERGYGD